MALIIFMIDFYSGFIMHGIFLLALMFDVLVCNWYCIFWPITVGKCDIVLFVHHICCFSHGNWVVEWCSLFLGAAGGRLVPGRCSILAQALIRRGCTLVGAGSTRHSSDASQCRKKESDAYRCCCIDQRDGGG